MWRKLLNPTSSTCFCPRENAKPNIYESRKPIYHDTTPNYILKKQNRLRFMNNCSGKGNMNLEKRIHPSALPVISGWM
jgi:hypothetical protein